MTHVETELYEQDATTACPEQDDPQVDWLARAWAGLPERSRAMFIARDQGMTLQEIGDQHRLTREGARQVLNKTARWICDHADKALPGWKAAIIGGCAGLATPRANIAASVGVGDHPAVSVLAEAAGLRPPRTWAGDLAGWWSSDSRALGSALRDISGRAPFESELLAVMASEYQIPDGIPLEDLLSSDGSHLIRSGHQWLRRRARIRDAAYLWMLQQGAPSRVEQILPAVNAVSTHALAEALRRDDRFVQIRPEGSWALAEWPRAGGTQYRGAVEAVVDLVTKFGPISKSALFAKAAQVYPVTTWRLEQCLLIDQIGQTPDGLIDLIARGAQHVEVEEPTKPDSIATNETRSVYGLKLTVDSDILRGSGVLVSPWLTWSLGLRLAPMSMTFDTDDLPNPLVVRRNTSGAQISSLRSFAARHRLVIGCEVAVVLLTDTQVARIRHVCRAGECPADAQAQEAATQPEPNPVVNGGQAP
ncbi:RNA polymerase subunit sigma-70 [Nocardia nova]|uniref:hypothetical protein n=1 Tax=Nocardia nova TaxID=37330 RepID=UPI0025B1E00A|nr:hypothetical protein [Nocardia nova]MDN2495884.1 RNA polymerase subunit sigma-70 [Nocardia nova]